ncbi:MAG: restriction endonuclease subunit S [Ferruginibacter sp.]
MAALKVLHKNKALAPKLRFKGFTESWEMKPLIELSVNGFSNGAFNDPKKVGSGYRIINVKDMYIDGTIKLDTLTRVAIDEKEFSKNRVAYGDIFFTRSSLVKEGIAYSNVNLNEVDDLTFDGHLIRMRPDGELHSPVFLYYNFSTKTARKQFIKRGKTATMTTIGQEDISKVEIIFPRLPEQQKIASFLSSVDEKIQQLTRKKQLLEQYKKGVMQQLFSGKLRFKDENGKAFPKWDEKRMGDVGDLKNGLNKDKNDFGFGSPFVNLMDVFGKRELNNQSFDLVNSNDNEKELYSIKKGDVLFIRSSVKRSGVGEAVVVNEDFPQTVYSGFLIRFRDDKKTLDQKFKKYCFANYSFRKELLSYATTSANTNINQESLRFVKLRVPVVKEQKKIANYLSSIDYKIEIINKQITQTQTFKKGLLQQMFV